MIPHVFRSGILALLFLPVTAKVLTFDQARLLVSSPQSGGANMSPLELQVTNRLNALRWEKGYTPRPEDFPKWKAMLDRPDENYYGQLCAASFLVTTDPEARAFVEKDMTSTDLRHRYNAAKILLLTPSDDPITREWMIRLMIQHIADGSLDPIPFKQPEGDFPDGDAYDDEGSPIDEFCYRLGQWKIPQAVPAILAYLQRPPAKNPIILEALGEIGDPGAIPFLMTILRDKNEGAAALGKLKAREAVPLLISKLSKNTDTFIHEYQGPDDVILRALRDIGDARAVEPIRDYLHAETRAPENVSTANRVLIELSSPDPVKDLIAQIEKEPSELSRGDILSDLANLYPDPRVVPVLAQISESSPSAFLRQRAIGGLGRIGTKPALLELVRLFDLPFPNTLTTDLGFKGVPTDLNAYFHDFVAEALRDATHQDFAQDPAQWRKWIEASATE